MSTTVPLRRRRRSRTVVLWAFAGCVLALIAVSAWVGSRALEVKEELDTSVQLAGQIRAAAGERDLGRLQGWADELAQSAARAAELTGDPIWRVAEVLPWVGDDLAATRIVSVALATIATDAVGPLLTVARDMQDMTSSESSTIDLEVVERSAPSVAAAAAALSEARDELATIDRGSLLPQLGDGVAALASASAAGAEAVAHMADAAQVLPPMLGADGPRTVLLMLQNNAELRTGGGISGAFAQLDAQGGKLSLQAQADSSEFEDRSEPILPIPDPVTALYGDDVGRFVQNTTMPADFALSARLASAWWQERTGVVADAVVSIDPIVLQSLLEATGPLVLDEGSRLTADNLVQRLLVEPYTTLDAAGQGVFQQRVTSAVFAHLLSGPIDPLTWAQGLAEPVADGRVSVWSAHDEEQALLADSRLAGPMARHRAAGDDAYAVYLNDVTGAKMDVFLDIGITTGVGQCRADGRRDVVIAVTATSTATADSALLPASVTGGGQFGIEPGDIGSLVTLAGPSGGYFADVRVDGNPTPFTDILDGGNPVAVAAVTVKPGDVSTVEFRFIAAEPGPVDPTIVHTPLLHSPSVRVAPVVCR